MADIDEIIGTDIAHLSDFVKDPEAGDLATVVGLENLRRAVIRRIITEPGTVIHRPNYGAGLMRYQNAPLTLSTQRIIAAAINEQLIQDPRIKEVLAVAFEVPDDNPSRANIRVRYMVTGYGEDKIEFIPFGEVT